MTANAMQGKRKQRLAAGMDDCVTKPIRVHQLVDALMAVPYRGVLQVSLIDQNVFNELKDAAGPQFVTELVGTFMEEAPGMLADLRKATETRDADVFRRAAHSLKSNSATFGAQQMTALARRLELDGMAADAKLDLVSIDALDEAYQAAAAALQELARG